MPASGKPGPSHLVVLIGFSRAERESEPQRVSAFQVFPASLLLMSPWPKKVIWSSRDLSDGEADPISGWEGQQSLWKGGKPVGMRAAWEGGHVMMRKRNGVCSSLMTLSPTLSNHLVRRNEGCPPTRYRYSCREGKHTGNRTCKRHLRGRGRGPAPPAFGRRNSFSVLSRLKHEKFVCGEPRTLFYGGYKAFFVF